ncbi:MAG TPA: type VI secretion system baseplate subunit TssF [Gammaproteobacteria bacterium]|nr:type VI secretion system baseplate subunit TssF [Gammaproteobacteria bacterium]
MKQDTLLQHYQEELAFIRQLGAKFAAAHPKIAGKLRLGPNSIEDPHVARLIEAVAFSNARVRQKLEDDFSEVSDALLQILHPNALSPIPAMAICHLQIHAEQLLAPKMLPENSVLFSETIHGHACRFKTCYPVELVPLVPIEAKLTAKPTTAPIIANANDCSSVLRLSLACTHTSVAVDKIKIDVLRFFINAPTQYAHAVYALLFQHTAIIAIAHSATDPAPAIFEPKYCLQPVGFKETEGMLPYSKRTFMGYRLLSEFFAFPEKFLFFDLVGLEQAISEKLTSPQDQLHIYFYLNQLNPALEKKINVDFFALGCTPIVNLYDHIAEPITFTNTQTEYNLIPETKLSPETTEIYAVKKVTASTFNEETIEFLPFYGLKHYQNDAYYHVVRKPAWEAGHYPMRGSEVFLAFSDRELARFNPERWVIHAEISCTNRDLPEQLQFNADSKGLRMYPLTPDFITKITCLTPMTPVRRPFSQHSGRWRYVSQLTLNHLALTNDEEGIETLRSLLNLYDFDQSDEHLNMLEGLLEISSHNLFIRSPTGHRGNPFLQGSEITLIVDETKFSSGNLFLFGSILSHFFGLHTSVNLFTQLVIKNRQQEILRFAPRAGDKTVL